jgi:hypothetical protein
MSKLTARQIELLAFAMWAKEKCTTEHGVNVNAWERMSKDAKLAWMLKVGI